MIYPCLKYDIIDIPPISMDIVTCYRLGFSLHITVIHEEILYSYEYIFMKIHESKHISADITYRYYLQKE